MNKIFEKHKLYCGRMIAGSKRGPAGHVCVWNANVVIKSRGKVWYGDLDITKEGDKLKKIAEEIGEPLYVLREKDCRFDTESDPVDVLITRAVWSTLEK